MALRRILPELSDLAEFLNDGIEELEEITGFQGTPEEFTWKAIGIPCIANTISRGTVVTLGGFEAEIRFTLIVRRDNFFSADDTLITVDTELFTADDDRPHPVAGRTLIFRGWTYRILRAAEAPGRGHYALDLGDPNT